MALNKTILEQSIAAIFNELKTYDGSNGKSQDDAITKLAGDLANAIDVFVKSGTVTTTVAAGIAVQVTPATGTGATIAPGAGTGIVS